LKDDRIKDILNVERYNILIFELKVRAEWDGDDLRFFDFWGKTEAKLNEHCLYIFENMPDFEKLFFGDYCEDYAKKISEISGVQYYSKKGWLSKEPFEIKDKVFCAAQNGGGIVSTNPFELQRIRNEVSKKYKDRFSVTVGDLAISLVPKRDNQYGKIASVVNQVKKTGVEVKLPFSNLAYLRQIAYTIGDVSIKDLKNGFVLIKPKQDPMSMKITEAADYVWDFKEDVEFWLLKAKELAYVRSILKDHNQRNQMTIGAEAIGDSIWLTPTNRKSRERNFMQWLDISEIENKSVNTNIRERYFYEFSNYSITVNDGFIQILAPKHKINQTTEILHQENQDLI
jgi:hypothetical protein